MAFLKSDDINYRVLRLGGGSVHGISQAQVLIFLEELAGIPVGWQYDLLSGDSIGSCAASALACPKEKGSLKPKLSAVEYESELVRLCGKTFEPYRNHYYLKMGLLEGCLFSLTFAKQYTESWTKQKDAQIQRALDKGFHATREVLRKLKLVNDTPYDRDNPDRLTAKFNVFSGAANKTILSVLEKYLKRSRKAAENVFFSAEPIHKAFDQFMRFEDGAPVLLSDAITGLHSEALNISKKEPTEHCYIKPVGAWDGYISHQNLPLSEIPFRSIAAQTVFKPYHSSHSNNYYDDIANQNTIASVMNSLRRKFTAAQNDKELDTPIKRHGLSIGTGMPVLDISPEKMAELLLLGRLDPANGAPLLNASIIFNTTKAIRDLKDELGEEHAIFIDKMLEKDTPIDTASYKRLMDKYNSASGMLRAHHLDNIGKPMEFSIIDARPEKIEQLRQFGWMMVWDHLEILVKEAKEGLHRAHRNGLISDRLLERRINFIDDKFPPNQMDCQERKKTGFMEFLSARVAFPKFGLLAKSEIAAPANDRFSADHEEDNISPASPSRM